jgi:hypothetical protein
MRRLFYFDKVAFVTLALFMVSLGGFVSIFIEHNSRTVNHYRNSTTIAIANQCQITTRVPSQYVQNHTSGFIPKSVRMYCLPSANYPSPQSVSRAFKLFGFNKIGPNFYGGYIQSNLVTNGQIEHSSEEALWCKVDNGWVVFTTQNSSIFSKAIINPTLRYFAQDASGVVYQNAKVNPLDSFWVWTHRTFK